MALYVDGFVIPISKKKVASYRAMSRKAGKIWKEHGALNYRECVGEDLNVKGVFTFIKLAKVKKGETVFFSWIEFKSRAHRDRVNKKVMADPRIGKICKQDDMPFDFKRMAYGGFKAVVEL